MNLKEEKREKIECQRHFCKKALCPFQIAFDISNSKCVLHSLLKPCTTDPNETKKETACLQKLADSYGVDRIVVLNQQGVVIAGTNPNGIGINGSALPHVANALKGIGAMVSVRAPLDGKPAVTVIQPVYIACNTIIGAVEAAVLLKDH